VKRNKTQLVEGSWLINKKIKYSDIQELESYIFKDCRAGPFDGL